MPGCEAPVEGAADPLAAAERVKARLAAVRARRRAFQDPAARLRAYAAAQVPSVSGDPGEEWS